MSKILIPLNNTTWGVIVNQVAANEYEHVLSFENEDIKKQFIGRELFNDSNIDYTELIKKQKTRAFIKTNDLDGTLKIDLDDINYKDEDIELSYTLNDLLNVDSIFIEEEGEVLLYAVTEVDRTANQNQVSIQYSLSLDVMFNSIDELDTGNSETTIIRAHTQRYEVIEGNKVEFKKENNIMVEHDLLFAEPVIEQKVTTYVDYQDDIIRGKYYIIYSSLNDGEEGVILDTTATGLKLRLPYKIFIGILPPTISFPDRGDKFNGEFMGNFMAKFGDSPTTQSITMTDISFLKFTEYDSAENDYTVPLIEDKLAWFAFNPDEPLEGGVFELKDISYIDDVLFNKVTEPLLDAPSYNDKRNPEYEVKLKLSQFKKYDLISSFANEPLTINQNYLNNQFDIQMKSKLFFSVNGVKPFIYTDEEKINEDNFRSRKGLMLDNDIELPINTDLYKEWASRHKLSKTTAYASGALGGIIAGGTAGAIGGSVVPGIGTLVGGVVGAGAGLVKGIGNHYVEMKDIKNTPDNPKSTSENYHMGIETIQGNSRGTPSSVWMSIKQLPDDYKQTVYDFLYARGYFIRKFGKIKNYTNTRYYFNFIQTDNIFSQIKNRYSANRKQIINDTFKNGFTIWHVRNLSTFKGISNYEYENIEI